MKKILTGLAGSAIVAGGLFYFGSQQLVADEINAQLQTLQTHGFAIEDRKQDATGDHFIISLADIHKFSKLLPEYESVLLAEDKSALKEFKLGVDLTSSGSEVSADIYPVSFPTQELSIQEKEMIDKYIQEKTLTLHINYDSLTQNFDGNLKDIDEQIKNSVVVKLLGMAFSGNITDEKIDLRYELNEFKVADNKSKNPVVELTGLLSDGTYEGLNYYVSNGTTNIDKFSFDSKDKLGSVAFTDIQVKVDSDIKNELFESRVSFISKAVDAQIINDNYTLDTFTFDYGMKNINLEAFEQLVTVLDTENPNFKSPEVEKSITKIFENGVIFDIHKIAVDNITHNGQILKGFSVQTNLELENNPAIMQKIETAPMQALSSVQLNSKIEISDELFAKAIQDPRAMMAMMVQPKQENGYKIYNIELKDSHLNINGQPMM